MDAQASDIYLALSLTWAFFWKSAFFPYLYPSYLNRKQNIKNKPIIL